MRTRGKPLEDVIIKENGMPAIIDLEVWKMAQARKKTPNASNKAKVIHLLTGILFCGKCGEKYIGNNKNGTGRYSCKNKVNNKSCDNHSVRQDVIENYIIDNILKLLTSNISDEFIEKLNNMYRETKKDAQKEYETTIKQIAGINTKIGNLVKALASGLKSESIVLEINKLEDEKITTENKLNMISKMRTLELIDKDFVISVINNDIKSLDILPKEEQKVLIQKYINKIIIYGDKIEINFNLDKKSIPHDMEYHWWAGVSNSHIPCLTINVKINKVQTYNGYYQIKFANIEK
jgi:site-specific DNA recombinase